MHNKPVSRKISAKEAVAVMLNGGLEPLVPYKSKTTPWLSKCLMCSSESSPTFKSIQNRRSKRKGCRHCAPNAPITDESAKTLMLQANLKPLEPYVNSTTKWKCECLVCGSIVYPMYNSIQRGQVGCLKCAGMLVNPEEAKLFFLENGLEPLVPYPGAAIPWKSRHTVCGKNVQPTYSNVRSGHSGCKYCIGNYLPFGRTY